ncbi:MAG: molybdopterin synthase catalytic subunit [Planctomycetota bacterium]
MASRMLEAIAHEEASREGVRSVVAIHSRGRVAVGEVSFLCEVRSAHRAEGLAALGSFIDRMKRDAPIWKRLVFLEHR